jgi:hypothetical protein
VLPFRRQNLVLARNIVTRFELGVVGRSIEEEGCKHAAATVFDTATSGT